MTIEDAKGLAELDKLCFAVPWSEKSFLEEAENSLAKYFVAKIEDEIVGYGGIWLVSGEGQITNIAVHPDMRKKGIASGILKELITSAADCAQIFLEVRESNSAAIGLYEKHGYISQGQRKNFYSSPTENALIMTKTFSEE
jgi:ribosomal-protein-alanine N-acetyltransferase